MLFHSLNTVIISTLVWATFVAPSGGSPQNIVLGITRFSTSIGNTTLKKVLPDLNPHRLTGLIIELKRRHATTQLVNI